MQTSVSTSSRGRETSGADVGEALGWDKPVCTDWGLLGNLSPAFFLNPSSGSLSHRHKVSPTQNVVDDFLADWVNEQPGMPGDSPQEAGEATWSWEGKQLELAT